MDDKSKRGPPDRRLVSAQEGYEVGYLAQKHEMPAPLVKKIVEQVGPSRAAVERKLSEMKKNGRR